MDYHELPARPPYVARQSDQECWYFALYLFVQAKYSRKAGPFSVARLKMDLPFHYPTPAVVRQSRSPGCPVEARAVSESAPKNQRHTQLARLMAADCATKETPSCGQGCAISLVG